MNPYTPPTTPLSPVSRPRTIAFSNPARFLLYPLGALCLLFCWATMRQTLRDGFRFRAVDFLNAGGGLLIGLLGASACYLAIRKLSKRTRLGTMLWSLASFSLLLVTMYFEPPATMNDFNLAFAVGTVLLSVGYIAYRTYPLTHGPSVDVPDPTL